jgi:hypothetical protein
MKRDKLEEMEKDIRRLRGIIARQQTSIEKMENDTSIDVAVLLENIKLKSDAEKIFEEKVQAYHIEEVKSAQNGSGEPDGIKVAKTTAGRGAVDIRFPLRHFIILPGTPTYQDILDGYGSDKRKK